MQLLGSWCAHWGCMSRQYWCPATLFKSGSCSVSDVPMVFAPWYADVHDRAPEVAPSETSKYEASSRHWGVLKDYEHPIRYAREGVASPTSELFSAISCKTLPEFFEKAVEQHGDKAAMRVERPCPEVVPIKDESTGKIKGWRADPSLPVEQWKSWTYAEYLADVKRAARAMMVPSHLRPLHPSALPHLSLPLAGVRSRTI
jgi:hypothetical protein